MRGDEGGGVGQLVMPPHPEREEDDGGQADDGNQGVEQRAEKLRLLGKRVGGGCGAGNQKVSGEKQRGPGSEEPTRLDIISKCSANPAHCA